MNKTYIFVVLACIDYGESEAVCAFTDEASALAFITLCAAHAGKKPSLMDMENYDIWAESHPDKLHCEWDHYKAEKIELKGSTT